MLRLGQFTPQRKLLFHADKITRWLNGENVYPILVEFDLSNACNHKCKFCTFQYITDRSLLDTDVAIRTIDELALKGVKAINWTGGGEPLMHRDFVEIAIHAHIQGLQQGLFTNGALLTEHMMEDILRTHTWVRFSIDAGTPETYEKLKGKDDFHKVMSIIESMVIMRNKLGLKCQIGTGFVITPDNICDIDAFGRLTYALGVDYGQYKPCINNYISNKQIDQKWWVEQVKPRLDMVFAENEKMVINLYKFQDLVDNFDRSYPICYGHIFCPCIGATGDVWLCTHMRDIHGFSMGNLYEKSFSEIWEGEERQKVIKKISFAQCQFGCKNNEINKILYQLKHPAEDGHYNFL